MILILPSQALVLNAYAVLVGSKPGNAALKEHQAFIATTGVGEAGYKAALEAFASGSFTTATLATAMLNNLGLNGAFTQAAAEAYLNANAGNRVGAMMDLGGMLYGYTGTDATLLTAKAAYVAKITDSYTYSNNPANANSQDFAGTGAQTFTLTTGMDNVVGTAGNDTFVARTINNANTFQDGDMLDGGAGLDTVFLDFVNVGNAITPNLKNIETVVVRAQSAGTDANGNSATDGNNMPADRTIQIDAQRSLATDAANKVTADIGVTNWESSNSRSDVVIEDVRIGNGQKTKDITITFRESDPGNVDFGVYFDQHSLRNTGTGTTAINILLMDTAAASAPTTATTPLLNHNFNTYTFFVDNVKVVLGGAGTAAGTALDDATTYPALKAAFELALKTANVGGVVQDLSGGVKVSTSGLVNMTNEANKAAESAAVAASFLNLNGEVITLGSAGTAAIASKSSTGEVGGWTAAGPAPSTGAIVQTFNTGSTSTTELVTSKIVLDDVGRGSTGGDLVVGGMSIGDTSTSRGVERFEITVEDSSKLQTINSTNNALREVTIVNGTTSNSTTAYNTVATNAGDLTVNGSVVNLDTQLPGVENGSAVGNHAGAGAAGFTDVRLIDASAMTGKLAFTAAVTTDSIAKYVTGVDTAANPAADVAGAGNVNFDVKGANFQYTGGANNDTMMVSIDGAVAASRSNVVSGLSDFTFDIAGGAGNDAITVNLIGNANAGNTQNWYNNQDLNNNISVSGGAGNDVIRTPGAGDIRIDAGAGNDTIYTDNTGARGQWVYNTTDQVTALAAARNIDDLRSDTNEAYNLFNSKLTVTFKNIPGVTVTVAGTGFKTTDLELNQAIKAAILGSATLSKLLAVQDGPANSLVVSSLIDGAMATGDLTVSLTSLTAAEVAALSASDIAAAGAAYGIVAPTAATVAAAITAAQLLYTTNGDYVTAMANDGAANITGTASVSTSDNIVAPGTGDDVVVLGTTVGADTAGSSNDTVVLGADFGNDVIVNLALTGSGVDHLDFTALKGATVAAAGVFTTDKAINIQLTTTLATSATVTTKAAIEALYSANNLAAQDHVFVAVSGSNVGSVYTVSDAIGATNAVATLQGTLDLGDIATSSWFNLTNANFVNSGAANYNLINGPTTGGVVAPPVIIPGAIVLAVGSITPVTATAAAEAFSFDVAAAQASAPNTQIQINGFDVAADSLVINSVTALGAVTLAALNGVDGIAVQTNGITGETTVNFGADANGDVITVTLAGVADATLVNINVI